MYGWHVYFNLLSLLNFDFFMEVSTNIINNLKQIVIIDS